MSHIDGFVCIEGPDGPARDAGMKKVMQDPRMDPSAPGHRARPFDGKCMISGGFAALVRVQA